MLLYNKKGEVTARTKFDVGFVSEVSKFKWYLKQGYVRGTYNGKKVFLHRLITNCPDNMVIDHIDRNPLNNLSANLRVCSQSENTKNRKYSKTNHHVGIKKVPSGKWTASITVMYKTLHLGTFDTFDEAVEARLLAETSYFKNFSAHT